MSKCSIPGKTDLATLNPKLAAEWHHSLNGNLKPDDVTAHSGKKVWWRCKGGHEWRTSINNRSNGDNCPYCSGRLPIPGETDLASKNPGLAAEWHPLLNGNLKPSDVTAYSNKKVWWRCKEGHEWQATINSRNIGRDCPFCSGRFPIPGETDLATLNPTQADEWHPSLNGELKPSDVTVSSGKKVWWRCKLGHEWQTTINSRNSGYNCPYCARQRVISGETDLATLNPALADEWHPLLNGNLKPSNVTAYSNKKVWWRCKEGHKWLASVSDRNRGSKCPYCFGRLPIIGETDLATKNPALEAEWHPTLNGDLKPSDVTPYSKKKVWWRCKNGHEWQANISNRMNGKNCPFCSGRFPIPGETDLDTVNPTLAAEWHPVLNGNLKPSDVTVHSNKKVWWRCKGDHEWQARIQNRSLGNDCPYCKGKRPILGKTDLATISPSLAAEWHPTLNGDLKPTEVTAQSNKKVWWRCEEGHSWKASIDNRIKGNSCPYDYGKKYTYKNRLIKTK